MFNDNSIEERLKQVAPHWRDYTLSIDTIRGSYDIVWDSHIEDLAFYSMFQIGLGNKSFSLQNFYETNRQRRQEEWNRNYDLGAYELPENANVLDVGSGIGINDLILYNYDKTCKLNMLDRDVGWQNLKGMSPEFLNGYNEDYIFYNSRNITSHAISCNGYDPNRFNYMTPEDEWEEYDLIISNWSWAWHYPLETYWEKAYNHLKPGGKLILDVYRLNDINFISSKLGPAVINKDYHGSRCKWVKT